MDTEIKELIRQLESLKAEDCSSKDAISCENFSEEYKELAGVLNTIIAERRDAFCQEKQKMKLIHQAISSGMWSMDFDRDGKMTKVTWSQEFRNMLGYTDTKDFPDVLESWSDRLHNEEKDKVMALYWHTVCDGGKYDVEYRLLTKTGQYRWYQAVGETSRWDNGKPRVFIGAFIDITQKKEKEEALARALIEARQANRVKTEFLSHMSHDIRTPINGILGLLTIAENEKNNAARQTDCYRKIRQSAEHLLSLVNDVLDISRLESGRGELSQTPFEMNEVLDSCMAILRPQAELEGLLLTERRGRFMSKRLLGSALHIRQILINIIGNAVKYNRPEGMIDVDIQEMKKEDDKVWYRFVIADTGIGMSEEYQKHIFEPFTQADSGARTAYAGSGLGMAITKKLTEKMGGTLALKSRLGEGSIFTVELPFKLDSGTQSAVPEEISEAAADISGMRVLAAEDNDVNREIMKYMFEKAGADIVMAENGAEALKLFEASKPWEYDCIIMDVMMPVMDGLEATRKIRALRREDACTIPIIALSANALAEDIKRSEAAGINRHVSKPLDTKKLFAIMAALKR